MRKQVGLDLSVMEEMAEYISTRAQAFPIKQ